MDSVTIPHRVGTIIGLQILFGRVRPVAQRIAQILGKTVGDVDAEPIHTFAAPESKDTKEFLMHFRIVPVEVGLLLGEGVQVVPAVTA